MENGVFKTVFASQLNKLRDLNDEGLMTLYAKQLMGSADPIIVNAVGIVMEERQMVSSGLVIELRYKDSKGKLQSLQLVGANI